MKVYGHPMSTCTRKVLTTLAEKGHDAEMVIVDLGKGEHKQPAHTQRHPFGVIPVLEDERGQLFESRAIMRYLDATLDGPKLTPADPRQYGEMEQWLSVESSYFTPSAMKIIHQKLFGPMRGLTPDQAVVEQGRTELARTLDVLEKALAGREFLVGDRFTLADIGYMPYIEYVNATGDGDLFTERENVGAWWKRISGRPSWQKATGRQA